MSHISADADVARWLKARLDRDYLNIFEVFVSSDAESIAAGDDWVEAVRHALDDADVLITLCSPSSIRRAWINFEIGAAWILGKTIIPVCHAGLTPRDLPIPLSLRQGMVLSDADGLRRLYKALSDQFGCGQPEKDFVQLAQEAAAAVDAAARNGRDDAADRDEMRRRTAIAERLKRALENSEWKWRTPERLAEIAGVTNEEAADVILADPEVRFGRDKDGNVIVGLVRRIGAG